MTICTPTHWRWKWATRVSSWWRWICWAWGAASALRPNAACVRLNADVDLVIACTHTHHGPDTIGLWGPDPSQPGVDAEYMAALMDTIVRVASEALASVRPATLRVNSTKVAGVAKNARDPEIVDIELSCLQFVDAASANGGAANGGSATVLATWLTFPCHPEVLWDDNPHITADYVAAMPRNGGVVHRRTLSGHGRRTGRHDDAGHARPHVR